MIARDARDLPATRRPRRARSSTRPTTPAATTTSQSSSSTSAARAPCGRHRRRRAARGAAEAGSRSSAGCCSSRSSSAASSTAHTTYARLARLPHRRERRRRHLPGRSRAASPASRCPRRAEETTVTVTDLDLAIQARLQAGLPMPSLEEAQRAVESYRATIAEQNAPAAVPSTVPTDVLPSSP